MAVPAEPGCGIHWPNPAEEERVAGPEDGARMRSEVTTAADAGTIELGDLPVNRLGYGAMRLTGEGVWGEPRDREAAIEVLCLAVELDVNLIDTADSYGPEVSERLIAEALHPYPEGLVIATKGGFVRPGPGRWEADGRPTHLKAACEGSLARLKVEAIDLYQLHAVDDDVPIEESLGALADLQAEGKIRHIGISNVTVDELDRAIGIVDVVSVQNRFSLADRRSEDVLDRCVEYGIGFLPWFPLVAGDLTGGGGTPGRIARAYGATPAQIALAWLLARAPVTLPIPGTSSVAHLEENIGAAAIALKLEDVEQLGAG